MFYKVYMQLPDYAKGWNKVGLLEYSNNIVFFPRLLLEYLNLHYPNH